MAGERAAEIGGRLRARREELGWTRRELANKLAGVVTENDLYRWESGRHRPGDDTLSAIAEAMGKDYAWAVSADPIEQTTPDLIESLDNGSQLDRIEDRLEQLIDALVAAKIVQRVGRDAPPEEAPAPTKRRRRAS